MKRYIDLTNSDKHNRSSSKDNSDLCTRWYAKFGEPRPQTMSKDEFMQRLKEMRDFE